LLGSFSLSEIREGFSFLLRPSSQATPQFAWKLLPLKKGDKRGIFVSPSPLLNSLYRYFVLLVKEPAPYLIRGGVRWILSLKGSALARGGAAPSQISSPSPNKKSQVFFKLLFGEGVRG
jgi:hypothetical protein